MSTSLSPLEILIALGTGLGLAAACGLRVFAPLLVMGLAARFGELHLAGSFAWVASTPALLALGVATVLEIAAYHVPWLDHALDVLATPVALIAGALAAVAVLGDLPPWLRWSAGLIGGGGAAGLVQAGTTLLRLKSLAFTAGAGNPVVAAGEWIGAFGLAILAIVLPLVALGLLIAAIAVVFSFVRRGLSERPTRA